MTGLRPQGQLVVELGLVPRCSLNQKPSILPYLHSDGLEDPAAFQNDIIQNKSIEVNPWALFNILCFLESILLCHYPLSIDPPKQLYVLSSRLQLGPGQIELINSLN